MKLAVIGTGRIVGDALYTLKPMKHIELSAIFARPQSREKGETLAAEYNIGKVYTDYDQLLAESEADAVYIGLVNNVHFEYAKNALLAGKHVILEKPFTCSYKEAAELKKLAEENGCYIMEAITVIHSDVFRKMQENLPKLGTIRMALCNFSQYSSRYDKYLEKDVDPCFDPEYGGGALNDINVYNIHFCQGLFGEPDEVKYYPNEGFNGIDTSGTLVMNYRGFSAVCTGAKDSDSPSFVSVQGEKGWMRMEGKPNAPHTLITNYVDGGSSEKVKDASGGMVRASVKEKFKAPEVHHRMTMEFDDFARMVDKKDDAAAKAWLGETIGVVRTLERAKKG